VNGDGYSDIAIGAPQYSSTYTFEGAAFVFFGSSVGLGFTGGRLLGWKQRPPRASVAPAGDANADKYGDLIVGSPEWDGDIADEGGYSFSVAARQVPAVPAAWTAEGNQGRHGTYPGIPSEFGNSVASAG